MVNQLFIFAVAIFLLIKGATLATQYASALAQSYRLSTYVVGFMVVALISILPETFISITSAVRGVPEFGLSVLFGSNIADLTLVFALIIYLSRRSIKVESKIIKNHATYPLILIFPLILGIDGHYSRLEGLALMVVGGIFYYMAFKNGGTSDEPIPNVGSKLKNFILLLCSMVILLVGSHFTVTSASALALTLGISPILIGMLVVGLGTTMPELFFSLKSVKKGDDSLAIGDILGTVLADATLVVGIIAMVHPFDFPKKIVYFTGMLMVVSAFLLLRFMRSGRSLTRKEAELLISIWMVFVFIEFLLNS